MYMWTSLCNLSYLHVSCLLTTYVVYVLQAGSSGFAAQQTAQVCLGLLGAVDPARVAIPPPPTSSMLPSDLALLVHLIERHLVRVLRVSAKLPQLDAAVFAIQVRQVSFCAWRHYCLMLEPGSIFASMPAPVA
jgi:hypothetical protein